jgi:hypothetical protein
MMIHIPWTSRGAVVAVLDRRGSRHDVVETAAEEAARRRAVLQLVPFPRDGVPQTPIADVIEAVRSEWPGLRVEAATGANSPSDLLAEAAKDAELVVASAAVVGDVIDAGSCPVLVVPQPHVSRWHRLVVAAVDGQPSDESVVAHAADEARLLGCELRVLHAYSMAEGESEHEAAARSYKYVRQLLARTRHAAGLEVSAVCTPGPLVGALAQQASMAELVVLSGDLSASHPLVDLMRHCGSGLLLVRRPTAPAREAPSFASMTA